jgi:hypothetical protein
VIQQTLQELYSSKSDEELLALAAANASLREDVKSILTQELQRPNLPAAISAQSHSRPARHHSPLPLLSH